MFFVPMIASNKEFYVASESPTLRETATIIIM